MATAKLVVAPPGDTPESKRIYDALEVGAPSPPADAMQACKGDGHRISYGASPLHPTPHTLFGGTFGDYPDRLCPQLPRSLAIWAKRS